MLIPLNEGGQLNQGARVAVFPQAELPPPTTTGREHDEPPPPPHLQISAPPCMGAGVVVLPWF